MKEQSTFYDEAKQTRREFATCIAKYSPHNLTNEVRTEIDSLLIMYDQAIEKARKWDELGERIGRYYDPDKEDGEHLLDIAIDAASAFNYL